MSSGGGGVGGAPTPPVPVPAPVPGALLPSRSLSVSSTRAAGGGDNDDDDRDDDRDDADAAGGGVGDERGGGDNGGDADDEDEDEDGGLPDDAAAAAAAGEGGLGGAREQLAWEEAEERKRTRHTRDIFTADGPDALDAIAPVEAGGSEPLPEVLSPERVERVVLLPTTGREEGEAEAVMGVTGVTDLPGEATRDVSTAAAATITSSTAGAMGTPRDAPSSAAATPRGAAAATENTTTTATTMRRPALPRRQGVSSYHESLDDDVDHESSTNAPVSRGTTTDAGLDEPNKKREAWLNAHRFGISTRYVMSPPPVSWARRTWNKFLYRCRHACRTSSRESFFDSLWGRDRDPEDAHARARTNDDDDEADDDARGGRPKRSQKRHPRIMYRDTVYHQTTGDVNVRYEAHPDDFDVRWAKRRLMFRDWFDRLLGFPTSVIVLAMVSLYTLVLLVWTGIYMHVGDVCGNVQLSFQAAFAFSLETATTVGYTLPITPSQSNFDMFFGGCPGWTLAIYVECMTMVFINGFILGIVLLRIQRADRRANQIVFSDKATVFCLRGRFYLSFQALDLQGHKPLINSNVRLLACFHDAAPNNRGAAYWQVRAMRIARPDDEIGARLWLTVPAVVVHEIDAWSPLAPEILTAAPVRAEAAAPNRYPQPPQRASDGRIGSRTQAVCPVCGSGAPTDGALRRHIAYFAQDEKERGKPEDWGHRALDPAEATRPIVLRGVLPPASHAASGTSGVSGGHTATTDSSSGGANAASEKPKTHVSPTDVCEAIRERIEARRIEIIALIEATDPRTSNSFQARHSFAPSDIAYNKQHAPCVLVDESGGAMVNLSLFHELTDAPPNIEEPIPFASHT